MIRRIRLSLAHRAADRAIRRDPHSAQARAAVLAWHLMAQGA